MDAVARSAGAMINAVMLGAIAASGRLPMPVEAFEAAIRADGKAVESQPARLCGGARRGAGSTQAPRRLLTPPRPMPRAPKRLADLEAQAARFPGAADIIVEGLRRLAAYQDMAYARLYLDRLPPIARPMPHPGEGRLLRETARHLAVRMSYEDVIRVAQAKIAPDAHRPHRRERRRQARRAGGDHRVPQAGHRGNLPDPAATARDSRSCASPSAAAGSAASIGAWRSRPPPSPAISGFCCSPSCAASGPHSYRYREEQAAIEAWLGLIAAAAAKSAALALEIAECARLIKGYGDTWKRGAANYAAIEARVIRPVLAGRMAVARGIDAIASARTAALLDPEGEASRAASPTSSAAPTSALRRSNDFDR